MNVAVLCARCSKNSAFQANDSNQLVVHEINSVGRKQHHF